MNVTDYADLLAAAQAGAPNDYPARHSYNGSAGRVNLATPVDHIEPKEKIVVGVNDTMDLTRTIAYRLLIAQGAEPGTMIPLTVAHIEATAEDIGLVISMWTIYRVGSASRIAIGFRASDVVSAAAFDAMTGATHLLTSAAAIEAHLFDEENVSMATMIQGNSRNLLLAIVANAIHRSQNEGHNWLTASANDRSSMTFRALAVAGAHKDEFSKFMHNHGHGVLHHLTTETINRLADAITGEDEAVVRDEALVYNDALINGTAMHLVFPMTESARDRWPVGQMGKAAIIVGLDEVSSMVSDIVSRLSVANSGALSVRIGLMRNAMAEAVAMPRPDLLAIRAVLSEVICIAFGYVEESGGHVAFNHPAVANLAKTNSASTNLGSSLYDAVAKAPANREAVAGAIGAALERIAMSMENAANLFPGGVAYPPPIELGEVILGESEDERMRAMLELARANN